MLRTPQSDVEVPAEEIAKRMRVMDEIPSKMTHEASIRFVDDSNQEFGISNEIEIMRPALARVLLDAADIFPNVEFRYGCIIQSLQQTNSKVIVYVQEKVQNTISKEEFDILVACDGLHSTIRDIILLVSESLKSVNAFGAFFTISAEPQDRPYWNFYLAPVRMFASTKPWTEKKLLPI
jgi:2-polyprenyl-6-methoxyphenol hydroxylase-like FAD-dependent oxidoreductase